MSAPRNSIPGRPRCEESQYFTIVDVTPRKTKVLLCNFCDKAHRDDPDNACTPEKIRYRKSNFQGHLQECDFAPPDVREAVISSLIAQRESRRSRQEHEDVVVAQPDLVREQPGDSSIELLSDAQQADRPVKKPKRDVPAAWVAAHVRLVQRALVAFQADNALPDSFIERWSTRQFLELLAPGVSPHLPSRRVLGGRMLQQAADEWQADDVGRLRRQQDRTGARVNFMCDGWQNQARAHLMGVQLSLHGTLLTFELVECSDKHDGNTVARAMEESMGRVFDNDWRVGAVVTDNAGQCAKARRILALRFPRIVFLYCFAHDINNLVKSVLRTNFNDIATSAATLVNTINASSAKLLVRARRLMEARYGKYLALIPLCETRWNSMQGCFASLLRVRTAMEDLWFECQRLDRTMPRALDVLRQPGFWDRLARAEKIISPLANASLRLQRDENTVADVVHSFREIYDGFIRTNISAELTDCLERRWLACEQPLFLLGYFLHPAHKEGAIQVMRSARFSWTLISDFAYYYYRRIVGENPEYIRDDIDDYIHGTITLAKSDQFQDGAIGYWRYIKGQGEHKKLAELAIAILSIAVNTATCERLFSELATIHTKNRNRLDPNKARRIHIVRKWVRQQTPDCSQSVRRMRIVNPEERPLLAEQLSQPQTPTSEEVVEGTSTTLNAPAVIGAEDNDHVVADDSEELSDNPTNTFHFWDSLLDEVFDNENLQTDYENDEGVELVIDGNPFQTRSWTSGLRMMKKTCLKRSAEVCVIGISRCLNCSVVCRT